MVVNQGEYFPDVTLGLDNPEKKGDGAIQGKDAFGILLEEDGMDI